MCSGLVKKYTIIVVIFALFLTVSAQGAENENVGSFSVRERECASEYACARVQELPFSSTLQSVAVLYEHDKSWPRWNYKNNIEAHRELVAMVKHLASKKECCHTIVIEGAASPIGSDKYNNALALRRAKILRDIVAKMEGGDKLTIHIISAGEDWEAFESHIEAEYHAENRREVLAILRMNASNLQKERYIQALDRGKTWRVLVDKFMDSSRNAVVVRVVESEPILEDKPLWPVQPVELISPLRIERIVSQEPLEIRKPVVAVRSNLLVPALNVGIEVPIGTNWSVAADYYFPWVWPKRDNKNCFELLAWGVEGRYWFGRNRTVFDRLQGHSLGLYGYMGYYDFERNYHGHQGEFVNVGIDYTYAMAVGKKKAVHFEFSLGIGYIYSQARKYSVIESGAPLISDKITKKVGFFGPTKANISLVVPIFQKVKPNDKQRGNE